MICCLRHSCLMIVALALIAGTIGLGFYFQWSFIAQNWLFFLILLCPLGHMFGGYGNQHDGKKSESKAGKNCH